MSGIKVDRLGTKRKGVEGSLIEAKGLAKPYPIWGLLPASSPIQ